MARLSRNPCNLEKLAEFIVNLTEGDTVLEAVTRAGTSTSSVYAERKVNDEFAAMWDDAYFQGTTVLETEAKRRAAQGVLEPVFHKGLVVGHVRKYSDVLLMFLMKKRDPSYREHFQVEASDELKQLAAGWKQTTDRLSLTGALVNFGQKDEHRNSTQH